MSRHPSDESLAPPDGGDKLPVTASELPLVARLVVEVRSDGSRTIARGAMEDTNTGMKAAIEAVGNSPLELALALAKGIFSAPWLQRRVGFSNVRALLNKLGGSGSANQGDK
jgi:hypothetical protein